MINALGEMPAYIFEFFNFDLSSYFIENYELNNIQTGEIPIYSVPKIGAVPTAVYNYIASPEFRQQKILNKDFALLYYSHRCGRAQSTTNQRFFRLT